MTAASRRDKRGNARTDALRRLPDFDFRSAYFDLEEAIRDVQEMAGIASHFAIETIGSDSETDGEDVILRVSPKDRERLIFAICQTSDMAEKLNQRYQGRFAAEAG